MEVVNVPPSEVRRNLYQPDQHQYCLKSSLGGGGGAEGGVGEMSC